MTNFDTDHSLTEVRIENKGDLPFEKLISKNALLVLISAIITAVVLVQEGMIFYSFTAVSCVSFYFLFMLIIFIETSQLLLSIHARVS